MTSPTGWDNLSSAGWITITAGRQRQWQREHLLYGSSEYNHQLAIGNDHGSSGQTLSNQLKPVLTAPIPSPQGVRLSTRMGEVELLA